MFDKKEMDFDDEGILRQVEPERSHKKKKVAEPSCACVWDGDDLFGICESHLSYYEHLQETAILTKDLYKAKCGFDKIWVVADSMNEAVELAEAYFESKHQESGYAVKNVHLSGKDVVLRGIPGDAQISPRPTEAWDED